MCVYLQWYLAKSPQTGRLNKYRSLYLQHTHTHVHTHMYEYLICFIVLHLKCLHIVFILFFVYLHIHFTFLAARQMHWNSSRVLLSEAQKPAAPEVINYAGCSVIYSHLVCSVFFFFFHTFCKVNGVINVVVFVKKRSFWSLTLLCDSWWIMSAMFCLVQEKEEKWLLNAYYLVLL